MLAEDGHTIFCSHSGSVVIWVAAVDNNQKIILVDKLAHLGQECLLLGSASGRGLTMVVKAYLFQGNHIWDV